jgi:hypothetical protein
MKSAPCFEIDCVINFWDLASYMEMNGEELFYKLWPDNYFEDDADYGHYAMVDVYDKICYQGKDEVREIWNEVKFYIEDCGYRFYDKVMFVF